MVTQQSSRVTVTFTGQNDSGAISRVVETAAGAKAVIVDLRQTVVQGIITLVIELDLSTENIMELNVYKSLLSVAQELNLSIDFKFQSESENRSNVSSTDLETDTSKEKCTEQDDYKDSMNLTQKMLSTQYVVTLLSQQDITPSFLGLLGAALAKSSFSTEKITRLSTGSMRCLEVVVGANRILEPADVGNLRGQLYTMGKESAIDVALQAESVLRRSKRLVVLDMDSTLIQQEVIDELARHAGVYEQVCEITHRAMGGGLDFKQSLAQRVALLKGSPASTFDKVISNLQYTPGAKLLCRTLKKLGYRLAVISGGFTKVTGHVKNELGLDYHYANQLEEDEHGNFTGRTIGPIVNAQRKADLLMTIAQQEKITLDQVIAIGDGANDLPMLGTAGLGIAFNAKPAVQKAARFRINQPSLTAVLYLLGLSQQDQEELCGYGNDI